MKDINNIFSDQAIGSGVDGNVYSIIDNKYCLKVVSKSVHDYFSVADFNTYLFKIKSNIEYLILNKCKPFVRVYDFKLLQMIPNKSFTYSYTMDKCNVITEDEYKVFHTVVSHEDNNIVKDLSNNNIKKILKELSVGLDFDFNRVIMFCNYLRETEVKHLDVHPRNIMKDNVGNFKLVDLDRIKIGE